MDAVAKEILTEALKRVSLALRNVHPDTINEFKKRVIPLCDALAEERVLGDNINDMIYLTKEP